MSLRISCPNCGERAVAPTEALNKRARCNVCGSQFTVKDAVQPVAAPQRSTPPESRKLAIRTGFFVLLALVVVRIGSAWIPQGVSGPPSNKPSASIEYDSKTDSVRSSVQDIQRRVADVERSLIHKAIAGDEDLTQIRSEIDRLHTKASAIVGSMNRRPGERGYSLAVRRQAAYSTLIKHGYTPGEAWRTVDAMEAEGLLPDPPRR